MPKTHRSPQLVTRLASPDMKRFRELAIVRGVTHSALLREATLQYLTYSENERLEELEGMYARQLKVSTELICRILLKCTDRICKMLAKIGIDAHAIYLFLARMDGNSAKLMQECTGLAAKRLSKKLNTEEQDVASGMVTQMSQAC